MAEKIAILGGGVAGCTAAFWLSDPIHQGKYDITVYQLGWRLGGKCASGRNPTLHERSQEHGLHVWFGFYDNAFRMLRRAYEEMGGYHGDFASIDEAFDQEREGVLATFRNNAWDFWCYDFPPYHVADDGQSLIPGDDHPLPNLFEIAVRSLRWLIDNSQQLVDSLPPHLFILEGLLKAAMRPISELLDALVTTTLNPPHFVQLISASLPIFEALRFTLHQIIRLDDLGQPADRERARLYCMMDLGLTCLIGVIRQKAFEQGLGVLDGKEFAQWLKDHGALYYTLQSPTLKGLYDVGFAYRGGDPRQPNVAAGVAVRCILRIYFGYKGAYLYKMNAGMGETVFTPLYLALKKRGVKFEFFHRVENLGLSADQKSIATIDITRQAEPAAPYDPLVAITLPSTRPFLIWPDRPVGQFNTPVPDPQNPDDPSFESEWCQVPGTPLTLRAGQDFDHVVLGIPVGALARITPELINASPGWQRMILRVETCRTQCLQLWLKDTTRDLGWDPNHETEEHVVLDAFVDPLNTWLDQTIILNTELWPGPKPQSLAYLCGPMLDDPNELLAHGIPTYPASQVALVEQASALWLDRAAHLLWPKSALPDGTFDWSAAYTYPGGTPRGSQFYRANIDGTERYVLSLADTTRYRLHSAASGFTNLFLAGDWTDNGLNVGAVEGAVLSGAQAARGISGVPAIIPGEKDF